MTGLVETVLGGPVATLRLADAAGRNALTPGLSAELTSAIARAVAEPASRVVLLAGLPDIFCSGATRDILLADPAERLTVGYDEVIRAPLRCALPVVAAMRGHAIGGGLLLGLYADLPVLSERSVYVANFLAYGFAPCMGATWVVPSRLGAALGAEVLLGAGRHRGRELAERGAQVRVVPHDEVETLAQRLAAGVAAAPRRALEFAKAAMVAPWLQASDEAFAREIDGHLESLGQAAVREAVADRFEPGRRPAGSP